MEVSVKGQGSIVFKSLGKLTYDTRLLDLDLALDGKCELTPTLLTHLKILRAKIMGIRQLVIVRTVTESGKSDVVRLALAVGRNLTRMGENENLNPASLSFCSISSTWL